MIRVRKLGALVVYFLVGISLSGGDDARSRVPRCSKNYVQTYTRERRIKNNIVLQKGPETDEIPPNGYRLEVNNTGPAVLDSKINFMAKLFNKTGHLADSTSFLYIWNNNADFRELRKEDNFEANMTETYIYVLPSQYTMQVCVYSKEEKLSHTKYQLVAKGETYFTITSTLNGNIAVKQNLTHQKNPKILATNTPIIFSVNLMDKFQSESRPTSSFQWFSGEKLLGETKKPKFMFTLKKPETVEKLSVSVITSLDDDFLVKKGDWSEDLQVKDAIRWVKWNISGNASVDVNKLLNFTVHYQASNPTVICWEVCKAHSNLSNCGNKTCEHPMTGNRKQFDVRVSFPSVGLYRICFQMENDVSLEYYRTEIVHVYDSDSYSSHGYGIPIFFTCLGILIVIVAGVYVVRIKRKPHVETADFDFHPALNRDQPHPIVSGIKRSMSQLFEPKHLYSTLHKPRTKARTYGSVSENDNSL